MAKLYRVKAHCGSFLSEKDFLVVAQQPVEALAKAHRGYKERFAPDCDENKIEIVHLEVINKELIV